MLQSFGFGESLIKWIVSYVRFQAVDVNGEHWTSIQLIISSSRREHYLILLSSAPNGMTQVPMLFILLMDPSTVFKNTKVSFFAGYQNK